MKLKPFKKEKRSNKYKLTMIILSSLAFIFLFIAIYQSFAAYNIKHSERIVDSKVGSMYDVRSMAIFIDGEPQPGMTDFPTDKRFSHVRCYVDGEFKENITGVWENEALTINGLTHKTDCNVYFVFDCIRGNITNLRECIIAQNGGESAIVARGTPDYSKSAVSQRIFDLIPTAGGTVSDHDGKHNISINYSARGNYEVSNGLFKTSSTIPGWTQDNFGLFSGTSATHEGGDSYYFRGDVRNNFVRFAGFWWRIIRIEGNGNIRLIYNGVVSGNNPPPWTGAGTEIGTRAFNSVPIANMSTAHIGFKHGTTCTSTYAQCHANQTNSTILGSPTTVGSLEHWYSNNIANKGTTVTSRIATNTIFCNDRNHADSRYVNFGPRNSTCYGSRARIENNRPSLQCINKTAAGLNPGLSTVLANHDQFATPGSGNGTLLYPVGLITSDEAHMSGSRFATGDNWLFNNRDQWTLSPWCHYFNEFANIHSITQQGSMSMSIIQDARSTRPVLSLRPDTLITSGNGTRELPYIIN